VGVELQPAIKNPVRIIDSNHILLMNFIFECCVFSCVFQAARGY
jgi:hypothetical protein